MIKIPLSYFTDLMQMRFSGHLCLPTVEDVTGGIVSMTHICDKLLTKESRKLFAINVTDYEIRGS